MAVGYLNERTQKIINMLLKQNSIFSIKEIAVEFSVSTRTIYNELDKANDWLKTKKLPEMVRHLHPVTKSEMAMLLI